MHQFIYSLSYPSLSLSIYSFTYCSLYSSTYSSAYPFILFSLHPFIFLYFSLSICPFNHPSIYPLQVMWSQAFPRPVCRLSPQSTPTPMRQWHSQRSWATLALEWWWCPSSPSWTTSPSSAPSPRDAPLMPLRRSSHWALLILLDLSLGEELCMLIFRISFLI